MAELFEQYLQGVVSRVRAVMFALIILQHALIKEGLIKGKKEQAETIDAAVKELLFLIPRVTLDDRPLREKTYSDVLAVVAHTLYPMKWVLFHGNRIVGTADSENGAHELSLRIQKKHGTAMCLLRMEPKDVEPQKPGAVRGRA